MAKLLPGGFPELTPSLQGLEDNLRNIIKDSYKNYGYINIETPLVERNDILTSKGGDEVSKQIFGLYGLAQGNEDLKDYSLHFDLTVPLARYVVEHENELKFPFKRSAMQKVFRGERHQRGRFKEFMQCDVDVIDENLDINYDVETIEVLYKTLTDMFSYLEINKGVEVHLNNKKFIEAICNKFNIVGDEMLELLGILDDYYKRTNHEFINGVYKKEDSKYGEGESIKVKNGIKDILGDKYEEFLLLLNSDIENSEFEDQNINEAFLELKEVYDKLKKSGVNVVCDPYITRGLDYYTGTVFETFIIGFKEFGSVCSGGRYEDLVGDIRKVTGRKGKNYGGVGGSIGLTRLFSRLIDGNLIDKKSRIIDALVFNIGGVSDDYKNMIIDTLRKGGISTDVYYKNDMLGKQFSYADNKNIPYGIFAGGNEEKNNSVVIKDLDTRDSIEVSVSNVVEQLNKKLNNIL